MSNSDLQADFECAEPLNAEQLHDYVLGKYDVDLRASYSCVPLFHPFGKAAGQLSMSPAHVVSDKENGLSFTVLKSAVGVTEYGDVGISDWQKSAPKMVAEKRTSLDGRLGWTVTWKGRGWDKGFEKYVELYDESLRQNPGYPVFPSLMVDVTNADRAVAQARYCISRLMDAHHKNNCRHEFLIEIDISPTLNLLPGADDDVIFESFVRTSVMAFREGLKGGGKSIVKLPNANRGAEFQLRLFNASLQEGSESIAGVIVGNRLFDKIREFEGQRGVAYGGYDLSNANLATLDLIHSTGIKIPLIGTGNICSGEMMFEYMKRGCTCGQIHTFLQLPTYGYRASTGQGSRTWRALRELLFHPEDGLVKMILNDLISK